MCLYDWKEYLSFSEQILADKDKYENKETISRIAISRAYYCAYHIALEFSKKIQRVKNIPNQYSDGSHETLVKFYKLMNKGSQDFKSECKSIGNILDSLKEDRHIADYKSYIRLNVKDAKSHCKKTRALIDKINKMDNQL